MGTDDRPGRPSADHIEEYAQQVKARSDGFFRIEPVWEAAGEDVDDWDRAIATLVIDGSLDRPTFPPGHGKPRASTA